MQNQKETTSVQVLGSKATTRQDPAQKRGPGNVASFAAACQPAIHVIFPGFTGQKMIGHIFNTGKPREILK